MPVNSTELHTFTCSVSNCKEQRTLSGQLGTLQQKLMDDEGWSFGDLLFYCHNIDLCPAHHDQLKAMLNIPEENDEA